MIYNDSPKTLKELEENKKRLRGEAGKETEAGKKMAQIQEEQRRELKKDVKKRELEDVKRKLTFIAGRFHAAEQELSALKAEKVKKESEFNNLENSFVSENKSDNSGKEGELAFKKSERAKIDAEIRNLQRQIEDEKRKFSQSHFRKEMEVISKKRLVEEEKNKISELEEELRKLGQTLNNIKAEEFRNEQDLRNMELRSVPDKQEIMKKETEISQKTAAEKKLERQIELLAKDLESGKNKTKKKIMIKEAEISNKKRLIEEVKRKISARETELQKLKRDLDTLKKQETNLEQELRLAA